jgi:hypothetical protein
MQNPDIKCRRATLKNKGYVKSVMAVIIMLAASISAMAGNSRSFSFESPVKLNGMDIVPGYYTIDWISHSPEATVKFTKNGQVVATAEGKWVPRDKKYHQDGVVYTTNADGSRRLVELRFAGMKQALVFGQPS